MRTFQNLFQFSSGLWTKVWLVVFGLMILLLFVIVPVVAQQSPRDDNTTHGFEVSLKGEEIFRVYRGVDSKNLTTKARADLITERLQFIANYPGNNPADIKVYSDKDKGVFIALPMTIVTVQDQDVPSNISSKIEWADNIRNDIQIAIENYKKQNSPNFLWGATFNQPQSVFQHLPNVLALFGLALLPLLAFLISQLPLIFRKGNKPWVDSIWVHFTSSLLAVLVVATACATLIPYLPGFGSPTFWGVAIIFGILFVLSSYTVVANAIAGLVLIYSSKWSGLKDGKEVSVDNSTGQQIIPKGKLQKSLFVTRISRSNFGQTEEGQDGEIHIFIPNSLLLNNIVTVYPPVVSPAPLEDTTRATQPTN